jgi:hypothetical protein
VALCFIDSDGYPISAMLVQRGAKMKENEEILKVTENEEILSSQ